MCRCAATKVGGAAPCISLSFSWWPSARALSLSLSLSLGRWSSPAPPQPNLGTACGAVATALLAREPLEGARVA